MNTEDESELSVGVRYLLAFKAKAGRDGLTLQASIRRDIIDVPLRWKYMDSLVFFILSKRSIYFHPKWYLS